MLEARNISFAYPGSAEPIYRDFSLSVEPTERVALIAPSGFGKTTLCRMLAGYEQPQQGEVLIDGKPLPKSGPCPVQLISQHPELSVDPRMRMVDSLEEAGGAFVGLKKRMRDELASGGEGERLAAPSNEADRLLDGLGIQRKWLSRFPHELSGGELQRFCVARALAACPRYLVADEISTMLDALTQAQIWDFLLSELESSKIGLVFVSHSLALTQRLATRTVVLGKG